MPPKNKICFSKIFFSLFFFGLLFAAAPAAVKAESYNVTGYAWSSNIGWISFNCSNTGTCGTSSYKVKYDDLTGKLSGYAWSSNIGWIKFESLSADSGGIGGSSATVNPSTGAVSGWARACAGMNDKTVYPTNQSEPNNTCTGWSRTDSWDGWIKMSASWANGVSINLTSSSAKYGEFSGYAWGSEVVGWISFNCSNTNTCGTSKYFVIVDLSTGICNYNSSQDNGETGVDCGGGGCPACPGGSSSSVPGGGSSSSVPGGGSSSSVPGGDDKYTLTINITGSGSGTVSDKNGVTLCHESA
ncbi:MAG: hypothetical protein UT80_C0044G0001, partial [Parcubacteria group bacterium GW2011_GWC1_40_13]